MIQSYKASLPNTNSIGRDIKPKETDMKRKTM